MSLAVFIAAVLSCVTAYLLGSLSFAVIISKVFYKKDIRTVGSGNAGMTNILRTFGKKAAVFTLVGDLGKGVVAVFLAKLIFVLIAQSQPIYGALIAGFFAVIGHLFPVYFGFKGGKGVSVAAGTILAASPISFLILATSFVVIVFTTKIVSLASVVLAVAYPIITFVISYFFVTEQNAVICTLLAACMGGLVLFMHRENIKRLANGTEYKFGQKKPEPQTNAENK